MGRGSKCDFAVQWCCWIIMKMKATDSGSIREQGNGAEADNTVRERTKTNKRTTVESIERSVRQYEEKEQRKGEKVKRQYIYDKQ